MGIDSMFGNMGTIITVIVAVPFLLVVLGLAYVAWRSGRKAGVSRNWSITTGKIISANVQARRSSSSNGGYSTSHYPQVIYEYTIAGQRYMGNRLNFGMEIGYGFVGMAENIIARFPIGGMVQVYYDPNDPSQAVLERSSGSSSKILWGVVVLILVILGVTVAFTTGINGLVNQVTSSLPK